MNSENYKKIIEYVQSTDKKGLNQAYNRVFNSNNKFTKVDLIQCCAVLDSDNVKEKYINDVFGFDIDEWICDFLEIEGYEVDELMNLVYHAYKNQ